MTATQISLQTARMSRLGTDAAATAIVDRLVDVAVQGLAGMYHADVGEFAFTRRALPASGAPVAEPATELAGTSTRYSAIAALGLRHLPEASQREVLGGETVYDLVGRLVGRLTGTSDLGDAAMVCWAAAETGHEDLPHAVRRLVQLDSSKSSVYVVEASWIVSALVAARGLLDVERPLAHARARLLNSRGPSRLFPHATQPERLPWYRSHIGCFADQVYPVQALARLHASADDPDALRAAEHAAWQICVLQGDEGQWWWHYDARFGGVVEGYPVYSVHQHAMAPMALLDLADAGGTDHSESVRRGLRWMAAAPETKEPLVLDSAGLTWRKVARTDQHKLVRAVRGASSRVHPSLRLRAVDRLYPPVAIDRECRPYEFGWFLDAWFR